MAFFSTSSESEVSIISKFNNSSFSGIIMPGNRLELPKNHFHHKTIIITNTGKSMLQLYRSFSVKDIIPTKSIIFYPGEVRKILPKELRNSITDITIIYNPDNYQDGGFAMSYV